MKIAFILGDMILSGRHFDFHNLWDDKRGMTGSELSVICYAREMARRGHDVAFFVSGPNAPSYDGVTLHPLSTLEQRSGDYEVIYCWCEPNELFRVPTGPLRMLNQQLNDFVYCKDGFDNVVDIYTSPSRWHLDFMSLFTSSRDKWIVMPNGTYPEDYDWQKPKTDGLVAYTSSPDRGLHLALEQWPAIRAAVPNARLRIYYFSLQRWTESFKDDESYIHEAIEEHARRSRYVKYALERLKDHGVEHIGGCSRNAIRDQLVETRVLAYPCDTVAVTEGFSVATLEGAASGALPVISSVDALGDIYGGHVPMVDAPIADNIDEWRELVVRALVDDAWYKERQVIARKHAETFAWPLLAERLEQAMERGLAVKRGVVMSALSSRPSDVAPEPAPPPVVHLVHAPKRSGKPLLHMSLTREAASGQTIYPAEPLRSHTGGGARAGYVGLGTSMARRGYHVRLFCPCQDHIIVDHGECKVEYVPIDRLDSLGTPEVLLAYFDKSVLTNKRGMLRVASHHSYQPYPDGNLDWVDLNLAPSQVAIDHLRTWNPCGEWRMLPNAIPMLGDTRAPVDGRVVHHASPSRGLHLLAEAWPEIKRRVPHATLHIIGPVNDWLSSPYGTPEFESSEQGKRVRRLRTALDRIKGPEFGVAVLNTLPRDTVIRELCAASVFAFPYSPAVACETFSVSIMECCQLGVPAVVSPADALRSIYDGHVLMVGDESDPARTKSMPAFIDAVCEVLTKPDVSAHWSARGKELAARYTYDNAANVLDGLLLEYTNRS